MSVDVAISGVLESHADRTDEPLSGNVAQVQPEMDSC